MKTQSNLLILVLLALTLSACAPATPPATPTPAATPTALPTQTVQPTRISAYIIDVPNIYLSDAQTILKDSQLSIAQWQRIEAWADYWIQCDNPPLDPAAEMYWDILFDNPDDPTESFLVINTGGAFYTTPVSYYGYWLDPPTAACRTLDPAYAPLLLASGEDRQWLRVQGGQIVQVDGQGQVVANIELQGVRSPEDFNMDEFHNLPQSYEYLLAHPNEFVQAPDPINQREGFDRWFAEQLVPALGPLSEREVNFESMVGPNAYGYSFYMWPQLPTEGQPAFFYFESSGVIYPVPCLNGSGSNSDGVDWTLCFALFDGPSFHYIFEDALTGLAEGRGLNQGQIYKDYRFSPDLDFGDVAESIDSIGDYTLGANNIGFGMGFLLTIPP
jgi:hypothetical protein